MYLHKVLDGRCLVYFLNFLCLICLLDCQLAQLILSPTLHNFSTLFLYIKHYPREALTIRPYLLCGLIYFIFFHILVLLPPDLLFFGSSLLNIIDLVSQIQRLDPTISIYILWIFNYFFYTFGFFRSALALHFTLVLEQFLNCMRCWADVSCSWHELAFSKINNILA